MDVDEFFAHANQAQDFLDAVQQQEEKTIRACALSQTQDQIQSALIKAAQQGRAQSVAVLCTLLPASEVGKSLERLFMHQDAPAVALLLPHVDPQLLSDQSVDNSCLNTLGTALSATPFHHHPQTQAMCEIVELIQPLTDLRWNFSHLMFMAVRANNARLVAQLLPHSDSSVYDHDMLDWCVKNQLHDCARVLCHDIPQALRQKFLRSASQNNDETLMEILLDDRPLPQVDFAKKTSGHKKLKQLNDALLMRATLAQAVDENPPAPVRPTLSKRM